MGREELKAKNKNELKELVTSKGVECGSSVLAMVEAILRHESKVQENLKAHAAKVQEVAAEKKQELGSKTNDQLKELCISRGLKAGVSKEDRIERLVHTYQTDGSFDKVVSQINRYARRQELNALEKPVLLELCAKLEVDPLMKEFMVERIMLYETDVEDGILEPASKKSRTAK